jgi:hypothetical protein
LINANLFQLFDLVEDPHEMVNLADDEVHARISTQIVREMGHQDAPVEM